MCKNSSTNQAYCYLSKDRRSLQFATVNTVLRDIGYDDIHFLTLSLRANWRCYHPTSPLVDREADFQGDLNEHAALHRIQDPWILPLPIDITLPSYSCDNSPLKTWDHTSPVVSSRPSFASSAPIILAPHASPAPPPSPIPSVDVNDIFQTFLQATLASNTTYVAAKPTPTYLTTTLLQPAGHPYGTSSSRHGIETATPSPSSRHASAPGSRATPSKALTTSQEPSPAPITKASYSASA